MNEYGHDLDGASIWHRQNIARSMQAYGFNERGKSNLHIVQQQSRTDRLGGYTSDGRSVPHVQTMHKIMEKYGGIRADGKSSFQAGVWESLPFRRTYDGDLKSAAARSKVATMGESVAHDLADMKGQVGHVKLACLATNAILMFAFACGLPENAPELRTLIVYKDNDYKNLQRLLVGRGGFAPRCGNRVIRELRIWHSERFNELLPRMEQADVDLAKKQVLPSAEAILKLAADKEQEWKAAEARGLKNLALLDTTIVLSEDASLNAIFAKLNARVEVLKSTRAGRDAMDFLRRHFLNHVDYTGVKAFTSHFHLRLSCFQPNPSRPQSANSLMAARFPRFPTKISLRSDHMLPTFAFWIFCFFCQRSLSSLQARCII
jgi:hypothetical protein